MLQMMEYPTPTISKQTLIHALNEMQAEHMARFMNPPRVHGFCEAKATLLKLLEAYDEEIDREKLDNDLDKILCQDHVPALSRGHATDMFFWTVSDFSCFIHSYPRYIPRSMEHIYPELVNR